MAAEGFARATRDYITDYIKFADAKAGAVLLFATTVSGAVVTAARDVSSRPATPSSWLGLTATAAVLVFAAPVLFCAAMVASRVLDALAPNVTRALGSFASFPDIAAADPHAYLAMVKACDEDRAAEEYAKHNLTLARVADTKFASISAALGWTWRLVLCGIVFCGAYAVALLLLTQQVGGK